MVKTYMFEVKPTDGEKLQQKIYTCNAQFRIDTGQIELLKPIGPFFV